ncbi:MAG: hypothetical protein ACQEXJ_16270 [Myxococcota bacterium]
MTDTDEAEAFARRVLAADRAANLGEPGGADARAALCTDEVAHGFEAMPEAPEPVAERRLYKVVRYAGGRFGAVVSQATSASKGLEKYDLQLVVREVDGAPRVISVWFVCQACIALGRDFRGDTCIECGGVGWERWFGEDPGPPSEVLAVRPIETPGSLYVSEYQQSRRAVPEE